jgi:ABC-type phosphate transport system substrate-binding protein
LTHSGYSLVMRRTGSAFLALTALIAVLALPGCGGGDESPSPGGDEQTTTEKRGYGY